MHLARGMGKGAMLVIGLLTACGRTSCGSNEAAEQPSQPMASPRALPAPSQDAPKTLPYGLLLAYAQFPIDASGKASLSPGAARLEILTRREGEWKIEVLEDEDSNVFHKAIHHRPAGGTPGILTFGGMAASVKLWRRTAGALEAEVLWKESFGGSFDRMRDAELGDVYGDGRTDIVIGTHDQGVVAVLRERDDGRGYVVERLDHQPNTFVHEIELGDLNGDGTLEVYATPSEPNKLGGGSQRGVVVRYVPRAGLPRQVVADLGMRHAKEIWVGDLDGDGRDELYVAADDQGELRRYVWEDGRAHRETILSHPAKGARMTWNISVLPTAGTD